MTSTNTAPSYTTDIAPNTNAGDVLLHTNTNILTQLSAILENIPNAAYANQPNAQTSSIGMHIRHIIEFYQELLKTLEGFSDNHLCYDNRQRDLTLEANKQAAIDALETIKATLSTMKQTDTAIKMSVITAPIQPMSTITTTLHRELYHLIDHTTHHMAIIKMIAQDQNIILDQNFGVASATLSQQAKI